VLVSVGLVGHLLVLSLDLRLLDSGGGIVWDWRERRGGREEGEGENGGCFERRGIGR
jgi:hypothetical protein